MANSLESRIAPVLAHYPHTCWPRRVTYLGNAGGFSGARFWRLETPRGYLCLRRWPSEHPGRIQLEFVQSVLWHVVQEGFTLVPLPLETNEHAGYVEFDGHFWQLEPWVPGSADYHRAPSPQKLCAAMSSLADFHRAAASFPLADGHPVASPGILLRLKQLRGLLGGELERIRRSARGTAWDDLRSRLETLASRFFGCAPGVLRDLEAASARNVRLQPCIRDIWDEHVFFEGSQVTGFVDFGAMRPENVAADVARLLGSMAGDDQEAWQVGLAAYERRRPLDEVERQLVQAFDRSTVLLSGTNWLRWVLLEGRRFDSPQAVLARIDANLSRMLYLSRTAC